MINKLKTVLLAGALSIATTFPLQGQNLYENLFAEGQAFFLHKNYTMSRQLIEQYLSKNASPKNLQEAEYILVCCKYELKTDNRIKQIQAYLNKYPDTPHTNHLSALIATAYYEQKDYPSAIKTFENCDLMLLPNDERDDCTYRLGVSNLKMNRFREASIWFHTLKGSSKRYQDEACYYLACIDYQQGNYTQALHSFQQIQHLTKFQSSTPYYIGEIRLQQAEYDKARNIAQAYVKQHPQDKNLPEMYRILGSSLYHLGQYNAAVEQLQAYVDATKQPKRNALYRLGMAYYQIHVYSRAATYLEQTTTQQDALTQNAYLHSGLAYLHLQDKPKARMAFEQAATLQFDHNIEEEALYNYALCIHETSYSPFSEAVTVFERFLNKFPHSVHSQQVSDYLVEVYMNTHSYEAALKSIAKIERPSKRILEAKQKILFQLGTQQLANARFQDAIGYFTQSLELGRFNRQTKANAFFWRGEAYYRLQHYPEAGRNFIQYMEFTTEKNNEVYALSQYNMGYVRFKQKDYSAAGNWFDNFIKSAENKHNKILADAYNRLGDCLFYARKFNDAQQAYTKASQTDSSQGDYSLYQEAFVLGLQKDYLGKIHVLNKLISEYPTSQYQDNAYYERGRAYVMMEDNNRAIESFQQLLNKFPESAIARKGANEIGLLYYQNDQYKDAIQAYRFVISTYPGSEEAKLAQRDLKSIYVDLNQVDTYADFISSIPGGSSFNVSERDSLTYTAAEKAYMRGETAQAKTSFAHYLQNFPEGAFSVNAHYYLALTDYNQKNYQEALLHLEKVLAFPHNKFSEEAMMLSAEIQFNQKNYAQAQTIYKQWKEKASNHERFLTAQIGILRTSYLLSDNNELIATANELLNENKLSPETANEARYYRAKAYVAEKDFQKAQADWHSLASDTRNIYGAEAKYRLGQLYFDLGETQKAEQEVLDYIECSTPHAYWLARSFILLSDVYTKMGRNIDAKQYLLSLQQNYEGNDDIASRIHERLQKLNP